MELICIACGNQSMKSFDYLTETNPTGADLELAKKAFSCFEPFNGLPEHYAISTAHFSQAMH